MTEEQDQPGGGSPPPAAADCFDLALPSDVQVVEQTVTYLTNCCCEYGFSGRRLFINFRVAISEALTNAIRYGNGEDPAKQVEVSVEVDPFRVVVQVTDQGNGFDPQAVPDPTLPENLHRPGGRGVYLIRQLMDEVEYDERGSSVRLVLYRHSPTRYPAGA
jgi:serine/threonine-protein kinase RsbW